MVSSFSYVERRLWKIQTSLEQFLEVADQQDYRHMARHGSNS
jgi:hypothetical protein